MRSVEGIELIDRDTLLSSADIVSLHTALTPETSGMIGRRELALMQDGAMLINTARGALVDEAALVAEIKSGRLRAGLDVYAEEPLPLASELRELPGCVLLPHVGSATSAPDAPCSSLRLPTYLQACRGEIYPPNLSSPDL